MTRSPSMQSNVPTAPSRQLEALDAAKTDSHLYARFVQRLHRRYADFLPFLAPGVPTRETLQGAFQALTAAHLDTSAALRVLRQITLERLAQLDCAGRLTLDQVTRSMTWLAEVTLDIAWQQVMTDLDALHGAPTKPDGQRAEMWICLLYTSDAADE